MPFYVAYLHRAILATLSSHYMGHPTTVGVGNVFLSVSSGVPFLVNRPPSVINNIRDIFDFTFEK